MFDTCWNLLKSSIEISEMNKVYLRFVKSFWLPIFRARTGNTKCAEFRNVMKCPHSKSVLWVLCLLSKTLLWKKRGSFCRSMESDWTRPKVSSILVPNGAEASSGELWRAGLTPMFLHFSTTIISNHPQSIVLVVLVLWRYVNISMKYMKKHEDSEDVVNV